MDNSVNEKSVNANFYSNVEGNLMSKNLKIINSKDKCASIDVSVDDATLKQINHRLSGKSGDKLTVNSDGNDKIGIIEVKIDDKVEIKAGDINNSTPALPYQPFKFTMSDCNHKPTIDSHLIQSIKSEEVLRTCQNVSNVLLQIPKYQEKLLKFSTNEFKSFCYTDKCNNLTEISVKCEPPVLNVPVLRGARGDDAKGEVFSDKGRDITSTLDHAEMKRKRKREKNVTRSSESEGEAELRDTDLWITKGPPAKLAFSEKKLSFLAIFGLTTLSTRNGKLL